RPSHARVKTWRRLQEVGALPARNSVYVLPNDDRLREDFQGLRFQIVALGGDATVFAADVVSPDGDDHLIHLFRRARAADYATITAEATRLLRRARPRRRPAAVATARHAIERGLGALQERLGQIQAIDFFRADGRPEAVEAVARLQHRATNGGPGAAPADRPHLDAATFVRRRWVTRPRPGVDRMASAWLIRRFIDPKATFAFVEHPTEADVPFDMRDVALGHEGAYCTFETIANRFGVDDPAVVRLGRIVHDLDLKDERFGLPETAAVGDVVDRLRQLRVDDHALLEQGIAVFEALARSFAASEPLRPAAKTRRPRRARP
ncbi:MAG TPA: chromate resistance protein ChrB domain-containing protein, partial [Vicinamibacterales bacterium]